jgi:DNA-directed RNA polymerase specialized sigma24 family protein
LIAREASDFTVGSLPFRQQVVIIARYRGGWSEAEIAEMLGCRPDRRDARYSRR